MKHILTLFALAGALSLAACERRPADPAVPSTTTPSGTTAPSTTAPPMPPASAASQ
jgi:hypothetical protein